MHRGARASSSRGGEVAGEAAAEAAIAEMKTKVLTVTHAVLRSI